VLDDFADAGGGTVKQSSTTSVERLIIMQHAAPPDSTPFARRAAPAKQEQPCMDGHSVTPEATGQPQGRPEFTRGVMPVFV